MAETSSQRYKRERSRRFEIIKGRTLYRRNLGLAIIPGVAFGLLITGLTRSAAGLVVAAIAGAAGPGVYHWWLLRQASDEARREVMNAWAAERSWAYEEEPSLPADVAFCRNREKPVAEHGFSGPMAGLDSHIFNFTYSTYETRTRAGANGTTETYREEVKHRHTVLRMALGDLGVHRVSLSPQGFGGGFAEKLRGTFTDDRSVQLESSEFNDRFCLFVADGADEIAVRRIFEPALVVRLVEGRFPLATFQFEQGALAFVWSDQYDVEELEEIEHRVSDATPIAHALIAQRDRLAPELRRQAGR
jgi:hypothetical protein